MTRSDWALVLSAGIGIPVVGWLLMVAVFIALGGGS